MQLAAFRIQIILRSTDRGSMDRKSICNDQYYLWPRAGLIENFTRLIHTLAICVIIFTEEKSLGLRMLPLIRHFFSQRPAQRLLLFVRSESPYSSIIVIMLQLVNVPT